MTITKEEIRQIVREEIEKGLIAYAESKVVGTAIRNGVYHETKQPS